MYREKASSNISRVYPRLVPSRGFQMGFDASMRAMGAGNLVQFELIQALCDEGVEYYDLGMDMNYKRRWAENRLEFVNLLVTP